MHTLIISDLHLSAKFYPQKLQKLLELIELAERVIILGDFWDAYLVSSDRFLASSWSPLFSKLQKGKVVYILGNHDCLEMFSVEMRNVLKPNVTKSHIFNYGSNYYLCQHGHHQLPDWLSQYPQLRLLVKAYPAVAGLSRLVVKLTRNIHRKRDNLMLKNWFEQHNQILKQKYAVPKDAELYFVTGHTHYQEVDINAHYLNPGSSKYRKLSWLEIFSNNNIRKYVYDC